MKTPLQSQRWMGAGSKAWSSWSCNSILRHREEAATKKVGGWRLECRVIRGIGQDGWGGILKPPGGWPIQAGFAWVGLFIVAESDPTEIKLVCDASLPPPARRRGSPQRDKRDTL